MKHLFVPYEMAVKAKEAGFNKQCLAFYFSNPYNGEVDMKMSGFEHPAYDDIWDDEDIVESVVGAPTYQQLVDWLRNSHQIYITIQKENIGSDEWVYSYAIEYLPKENWEDKRRCISFISIYSFLMWPHTSYSGAWHDYYEAYNQALTKALNLIANE